MNRIIINNKTDLADYTVMKLVLQVIASGRVSKNRTQYCYMTVFEVGILKIKVITDLRKNSDSFTIIQSK